MNQHIDGEPALSSQVRPYELAHTPSPVFPDDNFPSGGEMGARMRAID